MFAYEDKKKERSVKRNVHLEKEMKFITKEKKQYVDNKKSDLKAKEEMIKKIEGNK